MFIAEAQGNLVLDRLCPFIGEGKVVKAAGEGLSVWFLRLFNFHLADELFYFLSLVAEGEQGFAVDDLFQVEVNQGFVQRNHTHLFVSADDIG